jgi:hypothetical protein
LKSILPNLNGEIADKAASALIYTQLDPPEWLAVIGADALFAIKKLNPRQAELMFRCAEMSFRNRCDSGIISLALLLRNYAKGELDSSLTWRDRVNAAYRIGRLAESLARARFRSRKGNSADIMEAIHQDRATEILFQAKVAGKLPRFAPMKIIEWCGKILQSRFITKLTSAAARS